MSALGGKADDSQTLSVRAAIHALGISQPHQDRIEMADDRFAGCIDERIAAGDDTAIGL